MDAIRWQAGMHIVGTSLWCDALRPSGVCFASSLAPLLAGARGRRVVAAAALAKAAGELGLIDEASLLPARVGRPFAIGRARVEVMPLDEVHLSSSLLVEVDGRRVFYAADRPGAGAQLREASVLAIGAPVVARIDKLLDDVVKLIDQRLAGEETVKVAIGDPRWLWVLAPRAMRLSPSVRRLVAATGWEIAHVATSRLWVGTTRDRKALRLDALPIEEEDVAQLARAVGAETVFTTRADLVLPGLHTVGVGRPQQLGLWGADFTALSPTG